MAMKTCNLKRIQLENYQKNTLSTSHIEKDLLHQSMSKFQFCTCFNPIICVLIKLIYPLRNYYFSIPIPKHTYKKWSVVKNYYFRLQFK